MGIPCAISSYMGSVYIQEYIKRTKKTSFLLFILLGFMGLSFIFLIFSNIKKINYNLSVGLPIIEIRPYC